MTVSVHNGAGLHIIRAGAWVPDPLRAKLKTWSPKSRLGLIIKECLRTRAISGEQAAELLDAITSCVVLESSLMVTVIRHPNSPYRKGGPLIEDHGVVSRKVITTAGVAFLVDAWQNLVELEIMKYHGLGTGTTAEASSQSALTTELTTQYNPDNTRATGTTAENASNIFETVGTNTLDAAATVEEHGIFSQAATGGGTLWDRSLTGTQTLGNGDGLQTTYRMTATAGG